MDENLSRPNGARLKLARNSGTTRGADSACANEYRCGLPRGDEYGADASHRRRRQQIATTVAVAILANEMRYSRHD